MIVLDASALIALLDPADPHHERAASMLREHADEALAAHALTLAETLMHPARAGRGDVALRQLSALEVETVPLVADHVLPLAVLRASTGLRLPDCCVLLAARLRGAAIASFDERLTAAAVVDGLPVL